MGSNYEFNSRLDSIHSRIHEFNNFMNPSFILIYGSPQRNSKGPIKVPHDAQQLVILTSSQFKLYK